MSRYQEAGVDIHAGYELVNKIKKDVKSTQRMGTTGNIGSFGGTFDLSVLNVKEPVLVSGTDGVGTKLLIAQKMDKHDTIGIDCVAMCVNDILAQGAEPLYFLDYIATGKNDPDKIAQIVAGVAEGCRQAGTALIGGETAEMPDMYAKDEYDFIRRVHGKLRQADVHRMHGHLLRREVAQRASAGHVRTVRKMLDRYACLFADAAEDGRADGIGRIFLVGAELDDHALVQIRAVFRIGLFRMVRMHRMRIVARHHEALGNGAEVILAGIPQVFADAAEHIAQESGQCALLGP